MLSMPTVAISKPTHRLMSEFTIDFPASATTVVRPKNTAAKYSGESNLSASSLIGPASAP